MPGSPEGRVFQLCQGCRSFDKSDKEAGPETELGTAGWGEEGGASQTGAQVGLHLESLDEQTELDVLLTPSPGFLEI